MAEEKKSKHSPNTSEFTKPHQSSSEPELHVEQHSYDSQGRKDNSLTLPHITDSSAVQMGQETYDWHQKQRGSDKPKS